MNVDLLSNDISIEFYFHPVEIHKSDDEIKSFFYNNTGTLIVVVTKTNIMKMFDFVGKCVLFSINYFKERDLLINHISWSSNSEVIFITYENKKDGSTGLKKINFDFTNPDHSFAFDEQDQNLEVLTGIKIKDAIIYPDNLLFISGEHPIIYNISSQETFQFFTNYGKNNYTYIIKETNEPNSFFLFVKELYLILLIKENNPNNDVKSNYLNENMEDKNLTDEQTELYEWVLENLNANFVLVDLCGIRTNGEIITVTLNSFKTLLLINSTERTLRLFKYDYDSIVMLKDYFDSVNRKKWINAYFYTFKIKNSFQDLIVTALSDVNSLEFIFIDIETGNFIKRLEPFKYQCTDFICHYTNHFSIVLLSLKKIYYIYGYLINNWGAFAPQLKYVEENIEFIEDEAFFDNFNKNLRKKQIQDTCEHKNSIKKVFSSKNEIKIKNLFFKYSPLEDDPVAIQSEKDLRDVFQQFSEIMELNKK